MACRSSSWWSRGRKPKSKGLFTPAARASFRTDLSSSLHPSRTHSVTSSLLEVGRLEESSTTSLRGCREVPCCSDTGFKACFAPSRRSSARLELMRWSSLSTAVRRRLKSCVQSTPSRVWSRYSDSTAISWPASTSCLRSLGTCCSSFGRSFFRSLTSRSTSVSAFARTPSSAPGVRGSLPIRKIRAHRLERRSPSLVPSRCLRMISLYSRSSSPELRRSVEIWS